MIHLKKEKIKSVLRSFYLVGIIGLSLSFTRGIFELITPLSILFTTIILFYFHKPWKYFHVFLFVLISIASFFIEVYGVKTGRLFGNYFYGETLGLKFFETPIMIGVNWLLLLYCTRIIVDKLNVNVVLKIILASSLMVLYDIVLEPSAIYFDMWNWGGSIVPFKNYFAWFIISVIFHAILFLSQIKFTNSIAGYIYILQILFFITLDIVIIILNQLYD